MGLQAADVAVLISSDRKSQLSNTDVLVGTFCIFATHDTFTFINEWNEELLCVKHQGQLFVDEEHALWLEREVRLRLLELHSMNRRQFLKIVLPSATFPQWLMDELCKQLNL